MRTEPAVQFKSLTDAIRLGYQVDKSVSVEHQLARGVIPIRMRNNGLWIRGEVRTLSARTA